MKPAILHAHTEFSVRDSLIRVADLPRVAAEQGWGACAITDHGAIEGVPSFLEACKKVGIKGIAGCEIYCATPDTYHFGEKYKKTDKLHHLTILAKNAKGFGSLLRLLSLGHRDFYDARRQKAAIPLPLIVETLTDCVVLSGCFSSPFWRGTDMAPEDLVLFRSVFGDDFYLEVQPLHDWHEQISLNKKILDVADALGIEVVVTPDCHFGMPDEKTFHDALLAVADKKSKFDPTVWKFSTNRSFIGNPEMAFNDLTFAGFPHVRAKRALEMTAVVAEKCKEWEWKELPAPKLPFMEGSMDEISRKEFDRLGFTGRSDYVERLNQELKVFKDAGIEQYLLLVRHCLNLFRAEGAEIGPRGSVGGSLVAHCMGLTPLDPITHGLPYERFYYPGRRGWPDVDIDLDEDTRERASDILRREFGNDKVAQISNYTTYGLRMSIRDAARAYGVELNDDSHFEDDEKGVEDIEDIAPGKELAKKSPDAAAFARMMVGRMRQFGAHAGGFVITADTLMGGRSAIVSRTKDKALAWDMETADNLGFVKIDFLGVNTLSAIKSIGTAITTEKSEFDWGRVPLDDKEVFADLQSGLTAGVPQFLSAGLRNFLQNLKPNKFADLVWSNAAFRPGGLGQYTPEALAAKYNDDPGSVIVYQEEIMTIFVNIAGFTWTEADKVRKVVAKSRGNEEFEKFREPFIAGVINTSGWPREDADQFFTHIGGFARYAFNKAHATSYAWNSWRVAWAKRRYPMITFTAILNSDENSAPILDDASKFGITVLPPDANKSDAEKWTVEGTSIRMPLNKVPGIDLRIAKLIVRKREDPKEPGYASEEVLKQRLTGYKYAPSILQNLFSGKLPDYYFSREVYTPSGKFPKKELTELSDRERICSKCPLGGHCKKIVPIEFGRTNVMIIGESPGSEENRKGRPLVGPSGRMLDDTLNRYGISGLDFTYTNICHCQPPYIPEGQEGPMKRSEIEEYVMSCPWLEEEFKKTEPPLVLALGKKAWARLGGEGSILKANGTVIEKNGMKIVACLHPAFVLRDESRKHDFNRAIEKFIDLFKSLVPEDRRSHRDEKRLEFEASVDARARQFWGSKK